MDKARPKLPSGCVRLSFNGRNAATVALPAVIVARLLLGDLDQVYQVELTPEGILLRAVNEGEVVKPPPWVQ